MLPMIRAALACALLLGATTHAAVPSQRNAHIYLDPRLNDVHSATVSAIVTGTGAADLVARVGGTTTADLWLIDAVSAVIPTDAIGRLAAYPAVRSIVLNDRVETTSANDASGARRVNSVTTLPERMLAPGAAFAEGGFVSVGERGKVTLYGQDGKASRTFALPQNVYKKTPLVVGDTIVVVSEANVAYAFDRSGTAVWQRALGGAPVQGSLVASGGVVYAVDRNATLHALDGATGATTWTHTVANTTATAGATVGADGTVYYATANGTVVAVEAQGAARWTASVGGDIALAPVVTQNDAVLVTSTGGRFVAALGATSGDVAWRFTAGGSIKANPAVAADGTVFFGTENGYAYAVKANGAQRWRVRPSTGRFATSPLLSRDGALVYFAQTEDPLFAFDTATGMKRWSYGLSGSIAAAPVLDADDGILVGSDGGELVRLDDDGRATFKIKNQGDVTQAATTSADGAAMIRLDEQKVMTIGRLPDVWDGRPDARATGDPKVWDVVNPAAIDTGASSVHLANSALTGKPLRGAGVTVAVVDSGMSFDPNVRSTLGSVLSPLFKGQADFVDDRCVGVSLLMVNLCLTNFNGAIDPFGHGTAVSSIIWNNWTDANTGSKLGIAPDANILSVRVLDENGAGTYENVIEGIQYVVANRLLHNIRVMNVSISAPADIPYFADPLNRAVEGAWASGIVVVVAAGNDGSNAESIGAPGNDPYVITVGAVNTNRTPGHWADDTLPAWSATGPTRDGFVKPDILASGSNVLTMMYRDPVDFARSQRIVQMHPDQSLTTSLFRMNGTSMSAPIVSGVAALMLQANPLLTPDQVKYRLMTTARPSTTADGNALTYNSFQQGAGRVWAPDAVLGTMTGSENSGMNILTDLVTGYLSDLDLLKHYEGPAQKILSDDRQTWLYYAEGGTKPDVWLGFADAETMDWLDQSEVELQGTTWDEGRMHWGVNMRWEGGTSTASGQESEGAGRMSWGTGRMSWGTGRMSWGTGRMSWGTGRMSWGTGRMSWGTSVSPDEPVYPAMIRDR